MTVAIEDSGFEIRDSIIWMYGSGFPKSLDVGKAIDKQAGAERSEFYTKPIAYPDSDTWGIPNRNSKGNDIGFTTQGTGDRKDMDGHGNIIKSLPATPEAQQWHGWGTALKPAHEPAVLARKPLTGTVADNVLTWGVGALNIDGCRVGQREKEQYTGVRHKSSFGGESQDYKNPNKYEKSTEPLPSGRWPANVILDEHAAEALDAQSGVLKSGARKGANNINSLSGAYEGGWSYTGGPCEASSGGASRFFYIAKASRAEREAGLDAPAGERANIHPTLKPIALMRHLVRLVTPKGGTVLDPFMGSGSTGCAAMLEGMRFVGIDITAEYVDIAERRIQHWLNQNPMEL
jgi:site-specific DNA-methyltransferase (adenine-specific)